MVQVVGTVETVPSKIDGLVSFTLVKPLGGVVLCLSAPGYLMPEPHRGDVVVLAGNRKRELAMRDDSFELVYTAIEIQ